jgi:hypothetical protein
METPKIDITKLDVEDSEFIDTLVGLNEYRKSLPKKSQPKFLLFCLQISRTALKAGEREKALRFQSLYDNLRICYLEDHS